MGKKLLITIGFALSVTVLCSCGAPNATPAVQTPERRETQESAAQTDAPAQTPESPGDTPAPRPVITDPLDLTADEAREALKTWLDSHPFRTDSRLLPGNEVFRDMFPYAAGENFKFQTEIDEYGIIEVVVNSESGEMMISSTPYFTYYGGAEIEPLDDWYEREKSLDSPAHVRFISAKTVAEDWFDKYADSYSFTFDSLSYGSRYTSLSLFDGDYYYFDAGLYSSAPYSYHCGLLVQAETGEILFESAGSGSPPITVISRSGWDFGDYLSAERSLMTVDEAISSYNDQMENNRPRGFTPFPLEKEPFWIYVLFGELYYVFRSEDSNAFWFNMLVSAETEKLLYMETPDGMNAAPRILDLR